MQTGIYSNIRMYKNHDGLTIKMFSLLSQTMEIEQISNRMFPL